MLPEFSVITSDPGNQKQETFQKLHVTGQYYYSFSPAFSSLLWQKCAALATSRFVTYHIQTPKILRCD